ncbi:hypothetical protein RB195_002273 [Necator americanus]|uniref:Uncharacterized protein n=1 Tax=Necator americanus TaxID=51031 RepID=A0ABR1DL44_NECAM
MFETVLLDKLLEDPSLKDGPQNIPFCSPYISDDMSRAVRSCLRKANLQNDLKVVEILPVNLKCQLVRNRAYDRLCTTPSCVICPYVRERVYGIRSTASYYVQVVQ